MDGYFFNGYMNGIYSSPTNVDGGSIHDTVPLTQSSHKVIYDIFDELERSYPQFVTKKVIGEAFSREIRSYTIKNYEMKNLSDIPEKPFKICIVTSIHGYEQGCAWTVAQFFKLMLTSNDRILSFLHRNVTFEVIPVANPWGFDHNKRKNKNEVDLNRNFKPYFNDKNEKSSPEYAGEAPESEAETKAIVNFIEENKDAQVVLDYHNIAKGYPLFYVYSQRDVNLANAVFTALTDKWSNEYPELPRNEILGLVRPNGFEGMFADHLIDKGLWALTIETPWCMPVIGKEQYDFTSIRCAIDVLANTILALCSK